MSRFMVGMALAACVLAARAQVLTLDAARERAMAQQPALAALELNARALAEGAPAEAALPDPRFKLGLLNLPTRNFPTQSWEEMTQFVVSWEQMLPGGNKRRLRENRAIAESAQARAEAAGLRSQIFRDVGMAWLDAWQAVASEYLVRALVGEFAHAAELAAIGVASGRGPQAEIFAIRQMQSLVTDRGIELAAQAEKARAALRRWVPDAGTFELPAALPRWRKLPQHASLAALIEQHPQHAAHLRAQDTAEADVALAREATRPDKTIEVGYGFRAGMNRSDMLMVQVALELPVWRGEKQDRLVEARLRLAERARELRADHARQLRAELDAAHAEWRRAEERLANFAERVLPAAQGRLDTLAAAYSAGRAELAQVLEARRQLIEVRVQELTLQAMRARARIALEYFEHDGGPK